MPPNDTKKRARKIVSERLRLFFNHLKQQLASGAESLWERVETRLDKEKKER